MAEIFRNGKEENKSPRGPESEVSYGQKNEELKNLLAKDKMTDAEIDSLKSNVDASNAWPDSPAKQKGISKRIEGTQEIPTEIAEFFDTVTDIEKILPKDLQITKQEYIAALDNEVARVAVAEKTENALNFIANSHSPRSSGPLGAFLSFVSIRDKDVVRVQESYIDIKRSLSQ